MMRQLTPRVSPQEFRIAGHGTYPTKRDAPPSCALALARKCNHAPQRPEGARRCMHIGGGPRAGMLVRCWCSRHSASLRLRSRGLLEAAELVIVSSVIVSAAS